MKPNKKNRKNQIDNPVSQEQTMTTETAAPTTETPQGESQTILFTKRKTDASGSAIYAREGVRASVYIGKNLFGVEAPETIQITAIGFADPSAPKPPVVKEDPEVRKARLAEARKKAAEALAAMTPEERLERRAASLRAQLEKVEAAKAKAAATQPEGEAQA